MPTIKRGYSPTVRMIISETLMVDVQLLRSSECKDNRHQLCLGSTRLVRQSPMAAGADQPFPCLCSCHEKFQVS